MSAEVINIPESRVVDRSLINEITRKIEKMPHSEGEVTHRFTPGLYTRELLMFAGSNHLSKVHKTEHQFIISHGSCFVSENGEPAFMMIAPYHGITKPGTWRQLFIIMDCIWTTMHPTNATTVAEVEAEIIQPLPEESK